MAQEIKLRITVDGSGNVVIDQTTAKIRTLGSTGVRSAGELEAAFGRVKGMIGGLLGVAAAWKIGSDVVELNETLGSIARQGNLAKGELAGLKEEVLAVAKVTSQAPEELLKGIAKIMAKTGDLDLAVNTIRAIGTASSASGAAVEDLAAIVADLSTKFQIADKDIAAALDVLYVQGKQGAFELKDMATQAERLTAASAMMNLKGIEGMRIMGGLVQVIRSATGSAEDATTAYENLTRELVEKAEKIRALTGVLVFDDAGNPRRLDRVVKEIVENTDGDVRKLQEIFDIRSMRAINAFTIAWKNAGNSWTALDNFIKAGGDLSETLKDAASRGEEFSSRMTNIRTTLIDVADAFAPLLDVAASVLTFMAKGALMAAAGAVQLVIAYETLGTKIGITKAVREEHQQNVDALKMMQDDIFKRVAQLDAKTGDYGKTLLEAETAQKRFNQQLRDEKQAAEEAEKASEGLRKEFGELLKDQYSKLQEQYKKYIDAKADQLEVDKWYYSELEKLAKQEADRELAEVKRVFDERKRLMDQEIRDRASAYNVLYGYDPAKYQDKAAKTYMDSLASDEAVRRQFQLLDALEQQDFAMAQAQQAVKQYYPELAQGSDAAKMKVTELADEFKKFFEEYDQKLSDLKLELQDEATDKLKAVEERLEAVTGKDWTIHVNVVVSGGGGLVPGTDIEAPGGDGSAPPPDIPQYDRGIDYVTHDQIAVIHEGEAVLTKEENVARRFGFIAASSDRTAPAKSVSIGSFVFAPRAGTRLDTIAAQREFVRRAMIPELLKFSEA